MIGRQVILSHANHLYLDHPYEHDSREPGLSWATTNVDTRDVFNYHLPPASNASGVLPQLRRRLCDVYGGEEKKQCPSLERPDNVIGNAFNQSVLFSPRQAGSIDNKMTNVV